MEVETYYQRNKEKCKAQAKAYQDLHREEYRAYQKIYYQENKQRSYERAKKAREKRQLQRVPKVKVVKEKSIKKEKVLAPPPPPIVLEPVEESPSWNILITAGGVVTFD